MEVRLPDGNPISILSFLSDKYVEVPNYQRNYNWNTGNCDRLLEDLMFLRKSMAGNRMSEHFFGTVIYQTGTRRQSIIIDGQQRLTTVSLLLLAIRNAVKEGAIEAGDFRIKINDNITLDSTEDINKLLFSSKSVPRMTLGTGDRAKYEQLLEQGECDKGNMLENYNFLYRRVRIFSRDGNAAELVGLISHLQVVQILLGPEDDAQQIFETFNSTGMSLTEGDRIRNYILMNRAPEDQEEAYKLWIKIEQNVADVSAFFRNYLIAVREVERVPNENEVYRKFREYCLDMEQTPPGEDFLKDIVEYSEIYGGMERNEMPDEQQASDMRYINRLDLTVAYPFLMRVIFASKHGEDGVVPDDVSSIIRTVRDYAIRRYVCGMLSTGLNKMFAGLYKTARTLSGEGSFAEKVRYAISEKRNTGRCPDDAEVRRCLREQDLYRNKRRACEAVLSAIENSNKETSDALERVEEGKLSIEHVMPQTLTPKWEEELGPDFEMIHDEWLNKLGNLTLTAPEYNSKMSNKTFSEKKAEVYNDSPLYLNMSLKAEDTWGKEQIESRQENLTKRFLEVVPDITSDFIPDEVPEEGDEFIISLSEGWDNKRSNEYNEIMTGFILDGERVKTGTGIGTFIAFAKKLYELDPEATLNCMLDKHSGKLGIYVDADKKRGYRDFVGGYYIFERMQNKTKIRFMKQLLEAAGRSEESVQLLVRRVKKNKPEQD